MKCLESGKLTYKQIEAGRKSIRRYVQKVGSLWIRVFTNKSVTRKPIATRMGKGKGSHSKWICTVRAGQIIYEVAGLSNVLSFYSLKSAGYKLPFKTKVIKLIY